MIGLILKLLDSVVLFYWSLIFGGKNREFYGGLLGFWWEVWGNGDR